MVEVDSGGSVLSYSGLNQGMYVFDVLLSKHVLSLNKVIRIVI